MTGPEQTLGRVRGSRGPDLAQVGAGQQRVSHTTPNTTSQVFIAYAMGAWMGNWGGQAYVRLGIWAAASSSAVPGVLRARTVEIAPTVNYMDGGGGQYKDGNLETPLAINPGEVIAVGAGSRSVALGLAMYQASAISEPNESFYTKAITGNTLVTAVGSTASNEGQLTIRVLGEYNVPPNQPGVITKIGDPDDRQPYIQCGFSDANETLNNGVSYDHLGSSYIELWWGGVLRWAGTFDSTEAERTNRITYRQLGVGSITHANTQIPFDTPYSVFVYQADRHGSLSAARQYNGTVQSQAAVTTPWLPTTFITNLANPGNIQFQYINNSGLSANAVEVRLVAQNGVPYTWSGAIAKSVAPGGTVTVTWAETGWGAVPAGAIRGIEAIARDTNGNWSLWSGPFWFTTNSAPNVPVPVSPANGAPSPNRPKIVVTCSDADSSQTPTVYVRIKNSAGTVLQTRTMTRVGTSTTYEYQTVAGDLASYNTFKWDSYSYDGFLYSGGATSAASAAKSAEQTIVYAAVPVVVITAPAGPTVSTISPVFTWTCPNQTTWRLEGRIGGTLVYNTGNQTGAALTHTLQASANWVGGERWNNGEAINFTVFAQDSTTQWGRSAVLTLTLAYPPISELVVSGSAKSYPGVDGTHYAEITIVPSAYDPLAFRYYTWELAETEGFNGLVLPGTRHTVKETTNIADTVFEWHHLVSQKWYRVFVSQTVLVGNDVISSSPVSVDVQASWSGTLLHSNADPLNSYVCLRHAEGKYAPRVAETTHRNDFWTPGARLPLADMAGTTTRSASGDYILLPTPLASAAEQLDTVYKLVDWQDYRLSPNGRPNGICWREGEGGSRGLLFVTIDSVDAGPDRMTTKAVSLQFQAYHKPGQGGN